MLIAMGWGKMSIFKNYRENQRGNFSIMLSVGVSLIVMGIAASLETGNMVRMKTSLQSQVDIAALAAATVTPETGSKQPDYQDIAFDVMVDNGYNPEHKKPDIETSDKFIKVSTTIPYEGYFTKILGNPKLEISVEAESTLPSQAQIEMVLVLDNTKSMTVDGKMDALKEGATGIVDSIEEAGKGSKIGLVPFARYVNIGDASGSWLDKPVEYDTIRDSTNTVYDDADCIDELYSYTDDGVTLEKTKRRCAGTPISVDTSTKIIESRFEGCVGTNDKPDHLEPISSGNKVAGLLNRETHENTKAGHDVWADCPQPIRPLDNDYNDINKAIKALWGVDVTYIPSGLLWGERMLDRTDAFKQDPKEENVHQIMVLMTDGANTATIQTEEKYVDDLETPPYIWGETTTDPMTETDADTAFLCDRIKSKNIELFTISFRVESETAKTLVEDCASSPAHTFDAESNDALVEAFGQISKQLTAKVRLTR